jgi:hypothetical protein
VGETEPAAELAHLDSSQPVTKGRKNGIKVGYHEITKPLKKTLTNSETVPYFTNHTGKF